MPLKHGNTALHLTLNNKWFVKADMAIVLLNAEANVSIADAKNNALPLHYALMNCQNNSNLLKTLIEKSTNVINHKTKIGNTPLHFAVRTKNTSAIELLLKSGADCTLKNNEEKSPLDMAKEISPEIYEMLSIHLAAQHVAKESSGVQKESQSSEEISSTKEEVKDKHVPKADTQHRVPAKTQLLDQFRSENEQANRKILVAQESLAIVYIPLF